jgi:acetyl esterase
MAQLLPEVRRLLDRAGRETPSHQLTVVEARRRADAAALRDDGEPEPVGSVKELTIEGPEHLLSGRLLRPLVTPQRAGLIVYYHGGGFATGSVAGYDALFRRLANMTGRSLLAVDYRLAPEDPFPAAVEDAELALEWAFTNVRADEPIVVMGDSAGGNLATVVARRRRDAGLPTPRAQVLLCPITDLGPGPETLSYPSYVRFGDGYGFTKAHMESARSMYLGGASTDFAAADVSPLRADRLDGLPPALIITAEYDILRDEGEAYASRLAEAGVRVEQIRFDGHIHGSIWDPAVADSAVALKAVRRFLDEKGRMNWRGFPPRMRVAPPRDSRAQGLRRIRSDGTRRERAGAHRDQTVLLA